MIAYSDYNMSFNYTEFNLIISFIINYNTYDVNNINLIYSVYIESTYIIHCVDHIIAISSYYNYMVLLENWLLHIFPF